MNLLTKQFTPEHLEELGFFHDKQMHTGSSVEIEWNGQSGYTYHGSYRVWQAGFIATECFMQLSIKIIEGTDTIAVALHAGPTHLDATQFNLFYGKCKTTRDFKKIMKQVDMWEQIIRNQAANVAANSKS